MQKVECKTCNENFLGETKLRKHTCRIHVSNPAHNSLYMKNWYSPGECIRVFCELSKKEIGILRSKECRKEKSCPDLLQKMRMVLYI